MEQHLSWEVDYSSLSIVLMAEERMMKWVPNVILRRVDNSA
jgi:hypothetical protein